MEATKKMKTCELSGLYLYSETDNNGNKRYYLRARYDVEDEFRKTEIIYPKIYLPVSVHKPPVIHMDGLLPSPIFGYDIVPRIIDIGFGYLKLETDNLHDGYMYEFVKEEKAQKMTLSEIEKKLGHKIILVNEGK